MSLAGKLRPPEERPAGSFEAHRGASEASLRRSNGLKDFLWLMPEVEQGRLLDLGPVAQMTVTFFTDRGFRVTAEDVLRGRAEFEIERKRERAGKGSRGTLDSAEAEDPAEIAAAFLDTSLRFESESFHGVLAWDVFDFLETSLLAPLVGRLRGLMAPGGVLLAAFHDSMEVKPVSYRVRDHETVELVAARRPQAIRRAFQNREILALFSEFRSSRTYVGRDHLREALFLK